VFPNSPTEAKAVAAKTLLDQVGLGRGAPLLRYRYVHHGRQGRFLTPAGLRRRGVRAQQ
jgi:hypothetical protein